MERLQKIIANSGYCSRRKAEAEIKAGHVMVNGEIITAMGHQVTNKDIITVNNSKIESLEAKEYLLINKPRGVVVTTSDDKHRKTIMDLIKTDKRLYPVGRLDYETTGALLLTNDGELANLLTHPSNQIDKVYTAKIEGILTKAEISELEHGVMVDGQLTSTAKVRLRKLNKTKQTCLVEVTIHEGRNHEIKKMFQAIHHDVIKLRRDSFANLDVSHLASGESRYLNPKEVKRLYALGNHRERTN